MGWRPDWEGMFRGGLEGIEAMLSEDIKHKKKMKEMEEEFKLRQEEEDRKRVASMQEGIFTGLVGLMGDPDIDAFTKRTLYGKYMVPYLSQMGQVTPTQAGTTMPGAVAGMEGLPSMPEEEVAGVGRLFEAPEEPEEVKTYKYPYKKEEVREHEKFKAGLKPEPRPQLGKTPEERELDRAISIVNTLTRYPKVPPERKAEFIAARNYIHSRPEFAKRIAAEIDRYYDEMLRKCRGNHEKAMRKVRKYMNDLDIGQEMIRQYMRQR